ncbi:MULTISPECIES: glycosyltransferase [Micromonospora]|uniref:Glycosyl transferases group 1 n=1 Tax=Micromonospora carbonacea TaxID=47853 RepID=A0A1C5ADF8_9ACTN|nr:MULTISPECIES: glycosyltransferase [Micromonospora]WFE59672.1 glycosyltransferase [Micromonospora sp. WMMD712]SCF43282.1 Glycosyl transferases group 1 [Micromonospora carbonacea]
MRVVLVTMALRVPTDPSHWITVPPQGYAGIHWIVANHMDGLLELGHEVFLLGAPGTTPVAPAVTVVDAGEIEDMHAWLNSPEAATIDVVHDFSCGQIDPDRLPRGMAYLSTHHLTGKPKYPRNCVYASYAQRAQAENDVAPVVRISVNQARYPFRADKDDYLLYLGRISEWKGTYEAAAFASAAGRRLVVAGPSWEEDYLARIMRDFGDSVDLVGEVGGDRRLDLISRATAMMVLSQSTMGPWGVVWCEPGSTVVSEAAACGTPVIGTPNGCLAEIVPAVGTVVPEGADFTVEQARSVVAALPGPDAVRAAALERWDHVVVAKEFEAIYHDVLAGRTWT